GGGEVGGLDVLGERARLAAGERQQREVAARALMIDEAMAEAERELVAIGHREHVGAGQLERAGLAGLDVGDEYVERIDVPRRAVDRARAIARETCAVDAAVAVRDRAQRGQRGRGSTARAEQVPEQA